MSKETPSIADVLRVVKHLELNGIYLSAFDPGASGSFQLEPNQIKEYLDDVEEFSIKRNKVNREIFEAFYIMNEGCCAAITKTGDRCQNQVERILNVKDFKLGVDGICQYHKKFGIPSGQIMKEL